MPVNQLSCKKRSNAGFSLVEALIVVVILGILVLLAAPRFEPIMASRQVSAAKADFTQLYYRARMAAIQSRRQATLQVTGGAAVATISLAGGGTQRVAPVIFFDSLFAVSAVATPTSITIQPTGLVTGGLPFELVLTRSSVVDTVRISGFGRVE